MELTDLKTGVMLLLVIALVAAAGSLALDEFADDIGTGTAGGVHANASNVAYNITYNGLHGVDNTTSFLDTIGTIMAVTVLIGIVVSAFAFSRR